MSSSSVHLPGGRYRDWTSLPPEMLNHISECLCHLSDFIRFRSICPKWRASTKSAPPHLPWLLIDLRLPLDNVNPPKTGDLLLYSLLTKHIHNVTVPKAKGKVLLNGPCNHHVLTYDYINNHLLNPLSGDEICLPFLSSETGSRYDEPIPTYTSEHVGIYQKFDRSGSLISRRLTESDWKTFQFPCGGQDDHECHTLYKGKFYIYDNTSQELRAVDMDTGSIESIHVLPPESSEEDENWEDNYLVESFGELLRVSQQLDKFEVYSVDVGCENPRWVKKNSIGDVMIFLDVRNGFSLRAREFPGCSGNCIYFIDNGSIFHLGYDLFTVCKCYLDDGRAEVLTRPISGCATWFVPRL